MPNTLQTLLTSVVGEPRAERLIKTVVLPPALTGDVPITRALIAQALNMLLFEDLVARVPAAQA